MRTRHAFSLLELLTVLMILALIGGISFAAVFASQRDIGIEAAETVVKSLVRQARHTALSTGAPVEIRIEQNRHSDRWQIAGVSQTIVASETFDFNPDGSRIVPSTDRPLPIPGMAGYGWDGSKAAETNEAKEIVFNDRPLMRRPKDGFYLSCWYRPPPLRDPRQVGTDVGMQYFQPGITDTYRGKIVRYNPLILIGSDDPDTAVAGLTVELRQVHYQTGPGGERVSGLFWAPAGWVGDVSNKLVVADLDGIKRKDEMKNPVNANGWTQLGLHFDGKEFRIEVNNRFLADSRDTNNNATTVTLTSDDVRFASRAFIATHSGNGAPGIIDNVRILRLGQAQAQPFPKGIVPSQPYRIVADGGGITVFDQNLNEVTNGMFFGTASRADRLSARIDIGSDGQITSTILPEAVTVVTPPDDPEPADP